jgi:protein-S-isoprenylcysteine O-methyltransferase Ste14
MPRRRRGSAPLSWRRRFRLPATWRTPECGMSAQRVGVVMVVLNEEPSLEKRFGDSFLQRKRQVPRWLPRLPSDARGA